MPGKGYSRPAIGPEKPVLPIVALHCAWRLPRPTKIRRRTAFAGRRITLYNVDHFGQRNKALQATVRHCRGCGRADLGQCGVDLCERQLPGGEPSFIGPLHRKGQRPVMAGLRLSAPPARERCKPTATVSTRPEPAPRSHPKRTFSEPIDGPRHFQNPFPRALQSKLLFIMPGSNFSG